MASSTSFEAVNNSSSRFHTQRINRRLDDRDNVIKEAIAILEEKSSSYFPTVDLIVVAGWSNGNLASPSSDPTITLTGSNLGKTTDTFAATVGGVSAGIAFSGQNNSTEASLILTLDLDTGGTFTPASTAQGSIHTVRIHINETLATEFTIEVS